MELEPNTEKGKRLRELLENWLKISPEPAMDSIKRTFLMYSTKTVDEDSFLVSLYGQKVLDITPLCLRKQVGTSLLRIQHGIEVSLDKKCVKELIVAMEWSGNENVLTEILNWAEEATAKQGDDQSMDAEQKRNIPGTTSAAQVGPRTLISLFGNNLSFDSLKRRDREIKLDPTQGEHLDTLEVCGQTILVGLSNGSIKIYSCSNDLECQTVLKYNGKESRIWGLQCTCTEIIGVYSDKKIGVWNIRSKQLAQNFPVGGRSPDNRTEQVKSMRWRNPVLVLAQGYGRITVWERGIANNSAPFKLRHEWVAKAGKETVDFVAAVDTDFENVILYSSALLAIFVFKLDGTYVRCLSPEYRGFIFAMAFDHSHVIAGSLKGTICIWNVNSGNCVSELGGHGDWINSVDTQGKCIVSQDHAGEVTLWSLQDVIEERETSISMLQVIPPSSDDDESGSFRVRCGSNFFVRQIQSLGVVSVSDFPE